ncbi:pellicle/biofilm biosynthesis protein PelE [Uliginosibacterium flavum]|uniref:Uncharacterized protein n=1 Tax=Uliginosibacterium flavum TaxID=1396831 RepID=A0ABV2TG72_9RHOO
MLKAMLALYALLLECAAWGLFVARDSASDVLFIMFFMTHFLASASLASCMLLIVSGEVKKTSQALWALFFSVAAFMPLLGFVVVMCIAFALLRVPLFVKKTHFSALGLPLLDPRDRPGEWAFRQAGLRHFLHNDRAPLDQRLRALVTLKGAPTQCASPVLHDLLADKSDDLRLLAYGMLDSPEKRLNAQIHKWRLVWQKAVDAPSRRGAARHLSALHWELIYQGLVQGDLRRHAAESALRFLEQTPDKERDAGLHLRHGRLLQEMGRIEEAGPAYHRADSLGLPAPRVLPYLAELAFARRDFSEVLRLLKTLRAYPDQSRLQPLLRFWGIA